MKPKSTNLTNAEVNRIYLPNKRYERVGSCPDCNARCCNYLVFNANGVSTFLQTHGFRMVDKWNGYVYVVVHANCSQCIQNARCAVFAKKDFPDVCGQFPISPFDYHWRYLKQIGTPCGFDFVDKKTGRPWDMTLTERVTARRSRVGP